MRYLRDQKQQTRQRILGQARRLFAAQGFAATSIEQIMQASGLTHGGFYAHFESKAQLYHDTISHAATRSRLLDAHGRARGEADTLDAVLDEILQTGPASATQRAPRLGFFAADAGRREPGVRSAYACAFESISEKIRRCIGADDAGDGPTLAITAMLIGALAVAQTTDDPAQRARLLAACKAHAQALAQNLVEDVTANLFWLPAPEAQPRHNWLV